MNAALVRALAEKDLRVVLRSRMVVLPMLLVPLVLLVLIPAAIIVVPQLVPEAASDKEFQELLARLPAQMKARFEGYSPLQQLVVYVAGYMWAPLFLIVPLMVAGGVAADSFAGERERRTLEALLHTPLTDLELFAGKVAAAWVMAMLVAVLGFVLYGLTVNLAAWPIMGRVFFPNLTWLLLIGWVTPAVALLGLGVVVVVSARVGTAHEAFQAGGLVVLPVVVLLLGQVSGVLFLGPALALGLGAALWLLALGVLRVGFGTFRRTSLLSRV
ncbi:MAG TPA: ABC transporter permease subunit [Longimicrobiaceae bacterium]|nr:ABC transporter permease subunit [Longimicrobiaceae bacterium]